MHRMKIIFKGVSTKKYRISNLHESEYNSNRVVKHGRLDDSFRLCIRCIKAVFLLSLLAFILMTGLMMMASARDSISAPGGIHLISAHRQPWPIISRALEESRPQVFKYSEKIVEAVDASAMRKPPQIQQRISAASDSSQTLPQIYSSNNNNIGNNPLGLTNDIKIYVYDLPSKYNVDWLKDERCRSHLFAAEVAIHQNILSSPIRTLNPQEAHFFFLPVYVSCNFSNNTGFPILSHASQILHSAVDFVSHQMPYWLRNKGKDHVFVATHDYGACFHAMEDLAVTYGIPSFMQNSIVLQTFGKKKKHPCQEVDHIQIPPYVMPRHHPRHPSTYKRSIFAYFRGKMEIHPKNVSGRMYSRGVRTRIWKKYSHDRRFVIKRKRWDGYREEMLKSIFCLCPLGWAPWSPRIVESVMLGCVPVMIADNIMLPYGDVIDWRRMSISVGERDVKKIGKILEQVSATNLTLIQSYLWRDDVRRALVYHQPMTPGDATWQALDLLSLRSGPQLSS